MSAGPDLLVVAGEASGDRRCAELAAAIRRQHPGAHLFGVGGDQMRAAGVEIVDDVTALAVVGFFEVLRHLGRFRALFRRLVCLAEARRPDAVVLVDFPGFNLRLARAMNRLGMPVLYYISPQVWAWGRGRLQAMRRHVGKMIVIFPFEEALYREAGIDVEFVGHPMVDLLKGCGTGEEFRGRFHLADGERILALLPGSRDVEVRRHLPVIAAAADLIGKRVGAIRSFVAAASPSVARLAGEWLRKRGSGIEVVEGQTYPLLSAAAAAIVSSGTATLEAGCLGTPMAIVYRTSPLTYAVARWLVAVPHIGMVNIVAGQRLAPEFVQEAARPGPIADAVLRYLTDGALAARTREALLRVREQLGPPGAADRAARAVLHFVAEHREAEGTLRWEEATTRSPR